MANIRESDTYGPGNGERWRQILADLATDLATVKAALVDLQTKYNAHVHTENTAASYTQNAATAAPAAGSQSSASTAILTAYTTGV